METAAAALAARASVSRQKNCNNCVQAKRRCDRRTPVCSRCVEKMLPCIYSKTKVASQPDGRDRESTPYAEVVSFGSPACPLFAPGLSFDAGYLESPAPDPQPDMASEYMPQSIMEVSSSDVPMGNLMDLIGNNRSPSPDQWLVPTDECLFIERPSTPADEEVMRGYEKMAPICSNIDPWHLYDPTTPLYYIMSRVKGFTTDMATKNATPFLHRRLYRDYTPQCILSCFSTCVLYENRTSANTAMVMRALYASVRELIDAETCHIIATPTEKLGRAQALFLYQIIRLYDGDIALRAQGEKDIPLLQMWLDELCKIRDNLGDLARLEHDREGRQPPQEWERWIFAESVRRTIVMANSVISLYELMKDPENEDPGPWAHVHRWSLARSLWEANSSTEFYRMWKEKPPFVIANYSFEKFLQFGRGEDVDEFAEILLSVYMGVDATQEFISAQATQNTTA
ncbi:hypothetical protein F5Y19DRAFT_478596 [Xylariaceae sp. FL1651]|nr:hypothetical protein F5Y19DRAFT_478596 [Xylariaceae sp. FL1651]